MDQTDQDSDVPEGDVRARHLLRSAPLIDGHNDLPFAMRQRSGYDLDRVDLARSVPELHTDLPRLRAGGVGGQFWSVYVPCEWEGERAVAGTLEQIDFVRRLVSRYPEQLALATSASEIEASAASGRVASLMGAEGGHSIGSSLGVLRALFQLGVRYMTLTHNRNTPWADSATDQPQSGGLSEFGVTVVREMQRLGMLVDLSHVSPATMSDALDAARAPVIFSHSSALALCDHPRNVPDEILGRLGANGGVCMVTFVPSFVSQACRDWALSAREWMEGIGVDPDSDASTAHLEEFERAHTRPRATLSEVADHVDHVREVAGPEHVGLGGDFDGTRHTTAGLEDVSRYPALVELLLGRGWSESECRQMAGGNTLRAMRTAEALARSLSVAETGQTHPR